MNHQSPVVTRFAPSPTGFQHIGGMRTALFAYLFARQQGGKFILRIEDTDKSREVDDAIGHVIESLRWFNINWDYGPDKPGPFGSCIQSERLDSYRQYAEKLIAKGLAYPDPYNTEELEQFRAAAQAEKRPFLFRDHRPETFGVWDGSQPLRLKVPEVKRYTWNDAVRGELTAGPEMLDDIIIIKADGYPTYNFAHIIDDLEMGVTHVMRGDEFISSTPKFLSIYDALEIPYPTFVTLPPILRNDRTKKLGKRDGAKDVLEYRTEGYLPEAMVNYLALIGWNPGTDQELFTMDELIAAFSIDNIQRSGGAFNEEKLLWMNKEHLARLSDEEFLTYLQPAVPERIKTAPLWSEATLQRLLTTIRERVHTRTEATTTFEAGEYDFAFFEPTPNPDLIKWKNDDTPAAAAPRLQRAEDLLATADFSSPETLKAALWPYAEEIGRGELLWPLRVSLTGAERSPDPFTAAFVIGKTQTLKRLQAARGILEK